MLITRIACIDDHQLFLEGLAKILGNHKRFSVSGTYPNAKAFLRTAYNMPVDLVTSDIEMPDLNGIELCKIIKQRTPSVKVLFISMFETATVIAQAQEAGADGFLSKNATADEVMTTIDKIMNGNSCFQNPMLQDKVAEIVTPSALLLTKREKEITLLIKEAHTSKQIADLLDISEYTVETHRKNIFRKLKLKSLQELINFAHQQL